MTHVDALVEVLGSCSPTPMPSKTCWFHLDLPCSLLHCCTPRSATCATPLLAQAAAPSGITFDGLWKLINSCLDGVGRKDRVIGVLLTGL